MTANERRNGILQKIKNAALPISGTALAEEFGVSRQIIVQDIAILRSANHDIYATPKGYVISTNLQKAQTSGLTTKEAEEPTRIIKVSHTDEQMEDELQTIVDNGGKVIDVVIEHEVYGSIRAELNHSCRRHVKEFMEEIQSGKSRPLKKLASGEIHFHTITADSEETLDFIEEELKRKGYLL